MFAKRRLVLVLCRVLFSAKFVFSQNASTLLFRVGSGVGREKLAKATRDLRTIRTLCAFSTLPLCSQQATNTSNREKIVIKKVPVSARRCANLYFFVVVCFCSKEEDRESTPIWYFHF